MHHLTTTSGVAVSFSDTSQNSLTYKSFKPVRNTHIQFQFQLQDIVLDIRGSSSMTTKQSATFRGAKQKNNTHIMLLS